MTEKDYPDRSLEEEQAGTAAPGELQEEKPGRAETDAPEDFSYLDSVRKGTGERAGPLYRCMMVTTGQEEYVRQLMAVLGLGKCMIPRRVRLRRVRGEWKEDEVPLLPGYLFVHEEDEVPLWKYQQLLNVIRVLRYDQEPYGFMKAKDLTFAQTIFELQGRIQPLKAIDEGDYVRITDGLLKNLNGTVLSVDRHKRQAKIRLQLMGMEKVVYMNYVLLEKQEDSRPAGEEGAEQPADGRTEAADRGSDGKGNGASEGGTSV